MKSKQAVVLLSGGLDSAVALWWAKSKHYRCHGVSFDYGQRHNRELKSAKHLAKKANIPHHVVRFKLPWGGSSLTDKKKKLPNQPLKKISQHAIPSTYVPARNTIFLSFGLSWADQLNAAALVIGANILDYSGYPDCRPNYLAAFERVAQLGSRLGTEKKKKIKILSPLIKKTKAQIIQMGQKLGVPLHLTWSCYKGGAQPCGACDSCKLRNKGFKEASGQ